VKRLFLWVLLLLALSAPALAAELPFIQDDPAQALAEARQRKLPLFVEVWAPW
jgi:hypothetical protein